MTNACMLSQPTLVLNKSWLAIATTPVKSALSLLYTGGAQAIRPDTYEVHTFESWADLAVPLDEPCVRTVKLRIKVPEVIALTRYEGVPQVLMPFTRRNLFKRDTQTCQYCGARPGTHELTIDHVVPRSRGGVSSWENCVLACVSCNRRKGNQSPSDADLRLAKRPVAPRWAQSLEISLGTVRQSWEKFVSERYWNVPLQP